MDSTGCTFANCNGFSDEACALQCFNDNRAQLNDAALQGVYQSCPAECIDPNPSVAN